MAPKRVGTLNLLADREALLRGIDDLLALGPSERFSSYRTNIEHLTWSMAEMGPSERANLRHSVAEVQEAVQILEALRATVPKDQCEAAMRQLLRGDVTPRGARHFIELGGSREQLDEINDSAAIADLVATPIHELRTDVGELEAQLTDEQPRNAAFELSLAILARRAHVMPSMREPDWVFPTMFGGLAVAAKRVQSEGAILRRLTEGANQIENQIRLGAVTAGIVAMDVTLVLDLHRKHWVVRREAELAQLHTAIVEVMNRRKARILKLGSERGISAVLLHAKALAFSRETQRCTTVRPILLGLIEDSSTVVSKWLTGFVARIAMSA